MTIIDTLNRQGYLSTEAKRGILTRIDFAVDGLMKCRWPDAMVRLRELHPEWFEPVVKDAKGRESEPVFREGLEDTAKEAKGDLRNKVLVEVDLMLEDSAIHFQPETPYRGPLRGRENDYRGDLDSVVLMQHGMLQGAELIDRTSRVYGAFKLQPVCSVRMNGVVIALDSLCNLMPVLLRTLVFHPESVLVAMNTQNRKEAKDYARQMQAEVKELRKQQRNLQIELADGTIEFDKQEQAKQNIALIERRIHKKLAEASERRVQALAENARRVVDPDDPETPTTARKAHAQLIVRQANKVPGFTFQLDGNRHTAVTARIDSEDEPFGDDEEEVVVVEFEEPPKPPPKEPPKEPEADPEVERIPQMTPEEAEEELLEAAPQAEEEADVFIPSAFGDKQVRPTPEWQGTLQGYRGFFRAWKDQTDPYQTIEGGLSETHLTRATIHTMLKDRRTVALMPAGAAAGEAKWDELGEKRPGMERVSALTCWASPGRWTRQNAWELRPADAKGVEGIISIELQFARSRSSFDGRDLATVCLIAPTTTA
jgi:hypothetical protein